MRVLMPGTWLLDLHPHKHTIHAATATKWALVSAKHEHCAVDHFFNVPFQPSAAVVLLLPVHITYTLHWTMPQQSVWYQAIVASTYLRGPPTYAGLCLA